MQTSWLYVRCILPTTITPICLVQNLHAGLEINIQVSHELRSLLRESVPYVKLYGYNPKHLYPKLNGYGDIAREKSGCLWCLRTVLCPDVILPSTWSCIPTLALDAAPATLATGQLLAAYSGWKSMDNYDTCASVFVVLFNGFLSLTRYFDVMYRY